MNIYISNLDSSIDNAQLKDIFSAHGEVESAEIAYDLFTGDSRGFGYVIMENDNQAEKAIKALNATEVKGLVVSIKQVPPVTVHKGSYKVGSGMVKEYRFRKN